MILYLTGLNNVAPDQVEAARLDGAKGWKMLWYVILPQLRPATFIASSSPSSARCGPSTSCRS
jgi:multiple sugar transport system permease protein